MTDRKTKLLLERQRNFAVAAVLLAMLTSATLFALADPDQARPRVPASLWVCSFNIQFLGVFEGRDNSGVCRHPQGKCRDNEALARLLQKENCDIVVIQELDAPPSETFLARSQLTKFPMLDRSKYALLDARQKAQLRADPNFEFRAFPDGTPIKPVDKVDFFFNEMIKAGYPAYILSEEDTGPGTSHSNGTATEWYVTFFKPDKVDVAGDLPHGFISDKRFGPKDWQRTPYAFPFRTKNGKSDFVLISVHYQPDSGPANEARRKQEIGATKTWIDANNQTEKDFLILGDMNIESRDELARVSPYTSLNDACAATNTNTRVGSTKPYDHVLFEPGATSERELPRELPTGTARVPNFAVINLIAQMENRWNQMHPREPYPGGSRRPGQVSLYVHDRFRVEYSDHHPVKFKMLNPAQDDDPSAAVRR